MKQLLHYSLFFVRPLEPVVKGPGFKDNTSMAVLSPHNRWCAATPKTAYSALGYPTIIAICFFAVSGLWTPRFAAAADPTVKPVLLLVETAQNDDARTLEQAFLAELQLAMDRYRVLAADNHPATMSPPFAERSLQLQLAAVRKLAKPHRAAAVVWLTIDTSGDLILLHLAALSSGRALLRIVETPMGPNAEVDLALAVNELVGQAYLFDAQNPAAAVEASVMSSASQEMAPAQSGKKTEPPRCTASAPRRMFTLEAVGRIGIAGVQGPGLTIGAGFGVQRLFSKLLFLGGGLQLIAGPFEDRAAQQIENRSLAPYVDGGVLGSLRRLRMGVGLFISFPRQQTVITLPATGTHVYGDWNIRYTVRFMMFIPLGRSLMLSLSPDVGFWQNQKRYFAISSDRDIIRNPRLDAGLNMGLAVGF